MQYDIRIKGRQEVLVVPFQIGEKVKADWKSFLSTRKDILVEIEGWTGKISDIRDIQQSKGNTSEKTFFKEYQAEYVRTLHERRALAPNARAQSTGYFELVYWTFTGKNPTQEECTKAKHIQEEFFATHPKRTICDPSLFKPLITILRADSKEENHVNAWIPKSAITLVEQTLSQDIFAEQKL